MLALNIFVHLWSTQSWVRSLHSTYKNLTNDQFTSTTWRTGYGKEFGRMAQGDDKTETKGTNCMFAMTHKEILKF